MRDRNVRPEYNVHSVNSRIGCIGLGFVGYNSAIAFWQSDYAVVGVDTDDELVSAIRNGDVTFETNVSPASTETHDFRTSTRISAAGDCDTYVISVPTPLDDDRTPDLSPLRSACRDVATVLADGDLVVVQSTVYPGCLREELIPELERSGLRAGAQFGVSHVPERYSPGDGQSKTAPRIVGSIDEEWRDVTETLYRDVASETVPVSSLEVAETTKLMENVQRDVNIGLMNELAVAAAALDVSVQEVIDAADTKWNFHRYEPGLGVGGHCLPIDPHYLRVAAESNGAELHVLSAARSVNQSMPRYYRDEIIRTTEALGKQLLSIRVAVLGVTYKPDVKDLRNSPSLELIDYLSEESVDVTVFDSEFPPRAEIGDTGLSNDANAIQAVRNTDIVVVATGHNQFERLDPEGIAMIMREKPVLVDPQRTLDGDSVRDSRLIRSRNVSQQATRPSEIDQTERSVIERGEGGEIDD